MKNNHETTQLSLKAQENLVQAISNPKEPTKALIELMKLENFKEITHFNNNK